MPALFLPLGWARAWSTHTALNVALAAAFAVGAADGLLGLSIVVLEV